MNLQFNLDAEQGSHPVAEQRRKPADFPVPVYKRFGHEGGAVDQGAPLRSQFLNCRYFALGYAGDVPERFHGKSAGGLTAGAHAPGDRYYSRQQCNYYQGNDNSFFVSRFYTFPRFFC